MVFSFKTGISYPSCTVCPFKKLHTASFFSLYESLNLTAGVSIDILFVSSCLRVAAIVIVISLRPFI